MVLKIVLDHFLCHLPYCGAKIASCPEMPSPVPLLKVRELFEQTSRCPSFDASHDLAWRQAWWRTDQDVHVILAHYSSHNSYLKGIASLPHQLPYPFTNFPSQNLVPIFRNPHKVILDLIYRVATISVVHIASPLPMARWLSFSAKADRLKPVVLTF